MVHYITETHANAFGIAFALLMGLLLLAAPKRYAGLPIVALMCYMTMGTNLVVAGFNFTMLRVVLIFGWTRLIVRGELRSIKLNRIDWAVIAFVVSSIITYTILWGTYDAFKNKLGLAYNVLGFFFLFRHLLPDLRSVLSLVRVIAVLIVPLSVCMMLEKASGQNLFAQLGGVPAVSQVRDGVVRCQGPFSHPILAGSFGATLLPLFLSLALQKGKSARLLAYMGIGGAIIIVICAGSSGPVLAALAGILGLVLWRLRYRMRQIRWGIVVALVLLQLVMKPPVWFIMAKIDVFSGNTGWHRAHLIDMAYRNFFDWWLVGTRSNENWDVNYDHNYDITNQYIAYGIDGGLITMSLFILIIVRCFAAVGVMMRQARNQPRSSRFFLWALGAALFAHTMNYFSISYFDQNIIAWYMLLAMISSLANYVRDLPPSPAGPPTISEAPVESYA